VAWLWGGQGAHSPGVDGSKYGKERVNRKKLLENVFQLIPLTLGASDSALLTIARVYKLNL